MNPAMITYTWAKGRIGVSQDPRTRKPGNYLI